MKRLRYSVVLAFVITTLMFLYLYIEGNFNDDILIASSIFCFVTTTLLSYFRMFANISSQKQLSKFSDEIYSDSASHFNGAITVGGDLLLLKDKVVFQTNALGFPYKYECIIALNQLTEIHFNKSFGLFNNEMALITENGTEESFIVRNRDFWKNKIEEAVENI